MFMWAGVLGGEDTVDALVTKWGLASQMFDSNSGGSPSVDGGAVGRWLSDNGVTELGQSSAGLRPVCDDDQLPGRLAMIVSADKRLRGTVPLPMTMAMLVVGGLTGLRTILTIDTSATTTKPALAVEIEEYFG